MTPEEDASLSGYVVEAAGGYFYRRGQRNILPSAVNPEEGVDALSFKPIGAEPSDPEVPRYRGWGLWSANLITFPQATVGREGASLGDLLNRALEDQYVPNSRAQLASYAAEQGWPRLDLENVTILNAKTWKVTGNVGRFGFDLSLPAGSRRTYNPELNTNQPMTERINSRSGAGFYAQFQDFDEDGSGIINIGVYPFYYQAQWATYYRDPGEILMPPVFFAATVDGGHTSSSSPDSEEGSQFTGARYWHPDVTVLGRPILCADRLDGEGAPEPADVSLAVTVSEWWGPGDKWRGES